MKSPLIQAILALGLCSGLFAQTQQPPPPPPERAEMIAALQIEDVSKRIDEIKRIKAAYPESPLLDSIDSMLIQLMTANADSLGKVLVAQKELIESSKIQSQLMLIANAAQTLAYHPAIADFSGADVLKAVQDYKNQAITLLGNPESTSKFPASSTMSAQDYFGNIFEIPIAKSQLMNGNGQAALNALETYKKHFEQLGGNYYYLLGQAYSDLGRDKDALEAFMASAIADYAPATESAKNAFAKVHGSQAGFDAELKSLKAQLPFHPPPFVAPENWQGKAVLAELFTGSECPPCVAADFAFDGFIESYPAKHLVVLEYHLPIPRYDPMMNPATKARQDYYGRSVITGTPTSIIDGTKSIPAGGGRSASEGSFNRVKTGIDPLLGNETPVIIKATATLSGDAVRVDCEFSKVVDDSDYNIVLVQGVEEFEGGNGIVHHKMVVRDIETIAPATSASVTFNIPESEKSAEEYVTEWAKTVNQGIFASSKWPQINYKIDRKGLKAVVFVQDKESKQVHNAFVADVK